MEQPQNPEREAPISARQRHKHIMGKLKDSIFTALSASNPTGSVSQETKCRIERQLHEFFPHFGTPSHPPYALMIRTAITTLDEEGGSTEESISGFIEKEYEDLPWGHMAFLSHHLRKLCGTGEIVGKSDGRYMINVDDFDFGDKGGMVLSMNIRQGNEMLHTYHVGDGFQTKLKKKVGEDCHLIKQKIEAACQTEGKEIEVLNKWNKVKENHIEVFEQWFQVKKQEAEKESEASRQEFEASVQQRQSVESNDEKQNNPQNQQLEVTEEPNHLQTQQFEVNDRHTLECGRQTIVIEDLGMPQEQQIEVMNEKKMEDQEPCMEFAEYDNSWPMMEEEKRDYLKGEQQQLRKSLLTERATNTEVIEGQKLVQEQEDKLKKEARQPHELRIDVETKLFGLCCYNGDGVGKNLGVCDSPLLLAKEEQNKSLKPKEEQQQTTSTFREKQFIIVCGVPARKLSQKKVFGQQKALNSHLDNEQQKQSESQAGRSCLTPKLDADTTMSALLPSDEAHDTEQQCHCQPEGQGQGRPSKPEGKGDHHQMPSKSEGNGDHHQGLHIYFRRRHRL